MDQVSGALPADTVVAVIGAGTMGSGIAQVAASAGHPVMLFDLAPGAAERGLAGVAKALRGLVAKGRLAEDRCEATLARIRPCSAIADLAPAGLVIEAIIEDLAAKRALFDNLEKTVGEDCILATNTSSISIESIGALLARPERLVGMHFFNPAPLMALVEVVSGRATAPAIATTIEATSTAWGKIPVLARSTPGFIVNRVARPFYAEGLRVLAECATNPETLDAVVREAGGFRMGPCELMDLIGHDVNYAVTRSVWEAFHLDPRFQPSLVQRGLVEAGWFGRKTGRGFYDYRAAETPRPATAEPTPAPAAVTIAGDPGHTAALIPLLDAAGIAIDRTEGDGTIPVGTIIVGGVILAASDGRLAEEVANTLGQPVVLYDWALDWSKSTRVAIAASAHVTAQDLASCIGLFQAAGKAVSVIEDVPGLIVARTVAMLANEASDAFNQGVADARAIDIAMTKGVNYPIGPLAWADRIGAATIVKTLDNLARTCGEDRYRTSALLRRAALSGRTLHSTQKDLS